MTNKIFSRDYRGHCINFNSEGWVNATNAASYFGKEPADWLDLDLTKEYIERLFTHIEGSEDGKPRIAFTLIRRGTTAISGTWLHPKLATKFSRWLSVDFEIWCEEQLEGLVLGEVAAKAIARRQAAMSFRSLCEALSITHEAMGKDTKPYHYMNEARLINEVLTGAFTGRNRDQLTVAELEIVMLVENRDVLLLGQGKEYRARKIALNSYVEQLRKNYLKKVS
jgi:hypothetical protein